MIDCSGVNKKTLPRKKTHSFYDRYVVVVLSLLITLGVTVLLFIPGVLPAPSDYRPASNTPVTLKTLPKKEDPRISTHGARTARRVALTVDVSGNGKIEPLVQLLQSSQTPVTFFVTGQWIEQHPDATFNLAQEPLFTLE